MTLKLRNPASERKQNILQTVHDHLYPGRVLRLDGGGIDFVPDRREGYRYWDVDGRELLDLHLNERIGVNALAMVKSIRD